MANNDSDAPSTSWTFAVLDVERLAEGVYAVETIDLVDVVGNAAEGLFVATGPATLIVDRTAPTVEVSLGVTRLGPVAPHDLGDVGVVVDGSAVIGPDVVTATDVDVEVFVDDNALVCSAVACVIDAAVLDEGVHTVVARVGDAVGNVGADFASFFVDATPPAISPSTEVILRSPVGVPVAAPTTALVGTTVRVNLVTNEPVADPNLLELRFSRTGASNEIVLDREGSGEFVGVVGVDVDVGVYDLVVDGLNDDVGNVGSGVVVGALEVVGAVPTPCEVSFCADYDGDGVDGFSASCPTGLDCVDTNPHVWPGAPEIPGDGFGNACGNDDQAVDEGSGGFVSVDGDDDNDGSRAAPLRTITAGVARASACTPCQSPSLHGGFDVAWRRDPNVVTEVLIAPGLAATGGHGDALRMQATELQLTGLSFVVDGTFAHGVHLCAANRAVVDDVRVVGAATAVADTSRGVAPGMLLVEGTSIVRRVRSLGPGSAVGVRFVGDLRLLDTRAAGNVVVATLSSTGSLFVARSALDRQAPHAHHGGLDLRAGDRQRRARRRQHRLRVCEHAAGGVDVDGVVGRALGAHRRRALASPPQHRRLDRLCSRRAWVSLGARRRRWPKRRRRHRRRRHTLLPRRRHPRRRRAQHLRRARHRPRLRRAPRRRGAAGGALCCPLPRRRRPLAERRRPPRRQRGRGRTKPCGLGGRGSALDVDWRCAWRVPPGARLNAGRLRDARYFGIALSMALPSLSTTLKSTVSQLCFWRICGTCFAICDRKASKLNDDASPVRFFASM